MSGGTLPVRPARTSARPGIRALPTVVCHEETVAPGASGICVKTMNADPPAEGHGISENLKLQRSSR